MKNKVILTLIICAFLICIGCGSIKISNSFNKNESSSEVKQSEENNMKHEIITVTEIFDDYLVACNDKGEKYVIEDYQKYGLELEENSKIGISYTDKIQDEDGMYQLSIVTLTKEGTITIAPREK